MFGAPHTICTRLARAHVHGDHVHVVAVGMLLARLHITHDHAAVVRVARLPPPSTPRARQIEPVAERLLRSGRHVHIPDNHFKDTFIRLFPLSNLRPQ